MSAEAEPPAGADQLMVAALLVVDAVAEVTEPGQVVTVPLTGVAVL